MSAHDTPTRPPTACLLHTPPTGDRSWRRADDGYRTCSDCLNALRERLANVAARYHQLDPTPGATAEAGGRGAPGFRSTPAASLHVIAVRDSRSSTEAHVWRAGDGRVHTESTKAPVSVQAVLETEAYNVAELRNMTPPTDRTVTGLHRYLDRHLNWITTQDWVSEFARTIRSLQTQLMPLTGDPRIWVAKCPNVIDLGEHTMVCDANLYYPMTGDTIACGNPACGRKWTRDRWNGDTPGCLSQLIKDRRERAA